MNRINNLKGNAMLLLAAIIWGLAFVAQDKASAIIGSFTINAVRSFIGAVFLVPIAALFGAKSGEKLIPQNPKDRKNLIKAGVICGVLLCISVNLQQFGIAMYPPEASASARAGFLTALYVIIVPFLTLFKRQKTGVNVWLAALLSVVGLYLLCLAGGISGIYIADGIVLICALSFAVHIMCVDTFGSAVNGIKLSCLQFFVCGTISTVLMFIFEKPSFSAILSAGGYLLYIGIMSSGVAYTLQILGQRRCENPTIASIIMSLESVFAALGGLLFGDVLSVRETLGCAVMFGAIVLSQISFKKRGAV